MLKKVILIVVALVFVGCSLALDEPFDPSLPVDVEWNEYPDYYYVGYTETPSTSNQKIIMFYPGALVDPRAYIEMLAPLAGAPNYHKIFIFKAPCGMAFWNPYMAKDLIDKPSALMGTSFFAENIIIAGHSLGGAMACVQVKKAPESFGGLVLLGAYPGSTTDISTLNIKTLSITAENDLIATSADIEEAKPRLPSTTDYQNILGGNHAGFGAYGVQKGDGTATITQEEQHQQVVDLLLDFIAE
ncbi:MAG: hypothetical protein JXR63_06845 [Spirochaetales bacterium]|nr:hypothetical protein [Spirochaetales bacterium]